MPVFWPSIGCVGTDLTVTPCARPGDSATGFHGQLRQRWEAMIAHLHGGSSNHRYSYAGNDSSAVAGPKAGCQRRAGHRNAPAGRASGATRHKLKGIVRVWCNKLFRERTDEIKEPLGFVNFGLSGDAPAIKSWGSSPANPYGILSGRSRDRPTRRSVTSSDQQPMRGRRGKESLPDAVGGSQAPRIRPATGGATAPSRNGRGRGGSRRFRDRSGRGTGGDRTG